MCFAYNLYHSYDDMHKNNVKKKEKHWIKKKIIIKYRKQIKQ